MCCRTFQLETKGVIKTVNVTVDRIRRNSWTQIIPPFSRKVGSEYDDIIFYSAVRRLSTVTTLCSLFLFAKGNIHDRDRVELCHSYLIRNGSWLSHSSGT